MLSDNTQWNLLASLRKDYYGRNKTLRIVDALVWDPQAFAANSSSNGVFEAVLQGGFGSGKIPDAFESIVENGSGKVICDVIVGLGYQSNRNKLYNPSECKEKLTLEFTSNSGGGSCKMVGKGSGLGSSLNWMEMLNSQGNDVRVRTARGVMSKVSVIMKRTPFYLKQNSEPLTGYQFRGAVSTQGMAEYYHRIWCLTEISEQGLKEKDLQGLIGKKRKKCGDPKLLDQDLVRHIAEFILPPIFWLEEGDILVQMMSRQPGYAAIIRPRKGA